MKQLVAFVALFGHGAAIAAKTETREDVQNRLDNAAWVLHQILAAPVGRNASARAAWNLDTWILPYPRANLSIRRALCQR